MASKIVLIIMLSSLFLSPTTSSVLGEIGGIIDKFKGPVKKSAIKKFEKCVLRHLSGSSNCIPGSGGHDSEGIIGYQIVIGIGDPTFPFSGIVDTSSSLIWTQCKPCSCFFQPGPEFNPSKSRTFSDLPCDFCPTSCSNQCFYKEMYDEHLFTEGVLATETFTIDGQSFRNIVFGCGYTNEGKFDDASGIIGFGRDKWSLPSQLNLDNFSYCLNSDLSGRLSFDSQADMNGNPLQSTPLLQNSKFTSAYYVNLTGISVDDEPLPIPSTTFDLQADGTGGLILNSLFFVTLLQTEGYELVKEALMRRVNLHVADGSRVGLDFDLCFSFSDPSQIPTNTPIIKLHFDGAIMELQWREYMMEYETYGLLCSTILPSNGISVLGNLQQVNKNIFFDSKKSMLYFQTADCNASG